jgi:tetratricopeptide (TPR) repeat protein
VLDARGRTVEAVAAYRQAIELKSDYAEAYSNLGIAYKALGRLDDALRYYREALRLKPDFADVHSNLGAALRLQGRLDEAAEACRRAIELKPDNPDALNNLGAALSDAARLDEAADALDLALRLRPRFPAAQLNLAGVRRRQGRANEAQSVILDLIAHRRDLPEAQAALGELLLDQGHATGAEAAFRQVIELRPDTAEAHNNLANALKLRGAPAEAEAAYRQAIRLRPDYVEAHCNLAHLLHEQGRTAELELAVDMALRQAPADPLQRARLQQAVELVVPADLLGRLHDETWTEALAAAIGRAAPGAYVLALGAESGAAAMLAARAGAKSVTVSEPRRLLAAALGEAAELNGFGQRIQIAAKAAADLKVGAELARPATLLIAAGIAGMPLAAALLPAIEAAKAGLLAAEARVIPAALTIRAMLVGGAALERLAYAARIGDFDLAPFDRLAPLALPLDAADLAAEELAAPVDLFVFELARTQRFPAERRRYGVPVTRAGRAAGLLCWLRIDLDGEVRIENAPGATGNRPRGQQPAWPPILYRFARPLDLAEGQVLHLIAEHDRWRMLICPLEVT